MFPEALTFDDILLSPCSSSVLPQEVSLETDLTRNLKMKLPILSSAMDTVTESQMAIAMAQNGGIGVVHKNLSIEEQVKEVEIVKRAANGIVLQPKCLLPTVTIKEALEERKNFSLASFPIVDKDQRVLGIVTNRDFRFEKKLDQPLSSIMTKEVVTVKKGTALKKIKDLFRQHKVEKIVLTDNKGRLAGLICIKDILNNINYPDANKDKDGRLRVGAACGVSDLEFDRVKSLVKVGVDVVVVDTAHGHHEQVLRMVRRIKKSYPKLNLIGGNIATGEGCKSLIKAGVDAVKVGIGPGSICTTRIVTGVGVPQVTAIQSCVKVAKNIPVIADGGIKSSGDIVKALALGASSVMLGSMLSGTEESPGEVFVSEGVSYKNYRGMGSIGAMKKGSKDRYMQGDTKSDVKLISEGIEGAVPIKGKVKENLYQLAGGVRSAMGYVGGVNLSQLRKKAKFNKITNASLRESHVHDVVMIKESPNYKNSFKNKL